MNLLKFANSLLLLALLPSVSMALPNDKDQPIHIRSDSAEIDDAKGVSIYRGNVNIDQGSMNLTAEVVTIHNSKEGISKVIAQGNPAHYRQQNAINEPHTHAFGNTINYYIDDERIELRKNAKLEQEKDYFTGERIDYDIKNRMVNAYSNEAGGAPGQSRVIMVLQPKKGKNPESTEENSEE